MTTAAPKHYLKKLPGEGDPSAPSWVRTYLPPITYHPATPADELHILAAFSAMLRELEPCGHDVLPTDNNVDRVYEGLLLPAMVANRHAIYLAFDGPRCVGATFCVPEPAGFDGPLGVVTSYGLWVHPDYRRQGIAGELQDHAHRKLRLLGFTALRSTVLVSNANGLANCQRQGYRHVGYLVELDLKGVR